MIPAATNKKDNKIMRRFIYSFLLLASAGLHAEEAGINVVTTLPDLKSIAEIIGGDKVKVKALSLGYQDPHYVTPKPSLMAAVNKADLFVEIGLDLELWTERVLDGARNPKVRKGQRGHVYASKGVARLEIPQAISRAAGDLHPQGNPHIWLDPLNAKVMAANIAEGLKRVAPAQASYFDDRLKAFEKAVDERLFGKVLVTLLGGRILTRLTRQGKLIEFLEAKEFRGEKLIGKLGGWLGEARKFRGQKIITFHQAWVYFANRFGVVVANTIEEKPGIPPSAKRRDLLIQQARSENIRVIAVGTYYDTSVPEAMAEATGAKLLVLPIMTEGVKDVTDYFGLFDYLIGRLVQAFEEAKKERGSP